MSCPGTTPMYVIPRSSKSWPGCAKLTTDFRRRCVSSSASPPMTGIEPVERSQRLRLRCHVLESFTCDR